MDNINYINIVKSRIKYLDELSASVPISKAYKPLARLEEAKTILKLFEAKLPLPPPPKE